MLLVSQFRGMVTVVLVKMATLTHKMDTCSRHIDENQALPNRHELISDNFCFHHRYFHLYGQKEPSTFRPIACVVAARRRSCSYATTRQHYPKSHAHKFVALLPIPTGCVRSEFQWYGSLVVVENLLHASWSCICAQMGCHFCSE